MRALVGFSLLLVAAMAQAQTGQCGALSAPKALPIRPTAIAPIAPEMALPSHQLGAPTGVLAQAFDESLAVDQVLFRLRLQDCQLAKALPAPGPAPAALENNPSTYKPKTEFDNTPWRFNMSQNGKRMTADEFDAWMKARGVRVAKGTAAAAAAAPAEPVKDEKKK